MGRRLALLIGSSTYADPKLRRLHKPDADVASLASVLLDPAIGGFDDVQTHVDANVATLQRAVAALFAHKHTDDLLLLYFAGHGIKDEYGHLHLAAGDTDSELLSATALSSDFITREMDRSRSRKQIVVLDCCFSGAFSGTFAADAVGTTQAFNTDGVGRVILTATDAFQYAWEDEKAITDANSLFTHFLVEGIRSGNADINADGLITADEWYEFVYNAVRAASPKQTPQRSVYSGAGGLLIAHNPRPKVPLPDEIVVAMKSPLPYVREGVAHELSRLVTGEHGGLAAAARDALQLLAGDRDQRVRDIATTALRAGGAIADQVPPSTAQPNTLSQPVSTTVEKQAVETKLFQPSTLPAQPAVKTPGKRIDLVSNTASPKRLKTGRFYMGFFVFTIVLVAVIFGAAMLLASAVSGGSIARNHPWFTPLAWVLLLLDGLAISTYRRYYLRREAGADYSDLVAELHTSSGQIDVRFFPNRSLNHVQNFVSLAQKGFYNGTRFHYVFAGELIKGGDPATRSDDRSTWKNAGSDVVQKHEFSRKILTRGMIVMSSREGQDSSDVWQFCIVVGDRRYPHRLTIFGEVIHGLPAVDAIASAPCDAEHHPDNPTTIENITFRTGHFKQ